VEETMRSNLLTIEQIAVLKAHLQPTEDYLRKMGDRLLTAGFANKDPMHRLTWSAHTALSNLLLYLQEIENEAKARNLPPGSSPADM